MPAHLGYGTVLQESDSGKALLIYLDDLGEETWIPYSGIHDDFEVYDDRENSEGEVVIKSWFERKMREDGLI